MKLLEPLLWCFSGWALLLPQQLVMQLRVFSKLQQFGDWDSLAQSLLPHTIAELTLIQQ